MKNRRAWGGPVFAYSNCRRGSKFMFDETGRAIGLGMPVLAAFPAGRNTRRGKEITNDED